MIVLLGGYGVGLGVGVGVGVGVGLGVGVGVGAGVGVAELPAFNEQSIAAPALPASHVVGRTKDGEESVKPNDVEAPT